MSYPLAFVALALTTWRFVEYYKERRWLRFACWLLITLGGLSNVAVELANHDRMPVRGISWTIHDDCHVLASPSSRLMPLADIWGNASFRMSLGDILIVLGFGLGLINHIKGASGK